MKSSSFHLAWAVVEVTGTKVGNTGNQRHMKQKGKKELLYLSSLRSNSLKVIVSLTSIFSLTII